jgi:hypothetical protein
MDAEIALIGLREKLSAGKVVTPEFIPPWAMHFCKNIMVSAFDPSLLHAGFVRLCWPAGNDAPLVLDHATINLATPLKGFMATWDLAEQLDRSITGLFERTIGESSWIAIEGPPVGGGDLRRRESALIAGSVIYRVAVSRRCSFSPLQPRHISKVLTGTDKPLDRKKEIAEAVARYIPDSVNRSWSEHQRDAAAVALTFLYDLALGAKNES